MPVNSKTYPVIEKIRGQLVLNASRYRVRRRMSPTLPQISQRMWWCGWCCRQTVLAGCVFQFEGQAKGAQNFQVAIYCAKLMRGMRFRTMAYTSSAVGWCGHGP
jgi:hypothetical protein